MKFYGSDESSDVATNTKLLIDLLPVHLILMFTSSALSAGPMSFALTTVDVNWAIKATTDAAQISLDFGPLKYTSL